MREFISQDGNSLIRSRDHEHLWIMPWGKDGVRVRVTREHRFLDLPNALLESPAAAEDVSVDIGEDMSVLRNGEVSVHIEPNGKLSFLRTSTGDIVLEEWDVTSAVFHARQFKADRGLWHAELRFKPNDTERFYGLGQHQHGSLDQKGCVIELEQRNTEVAIPFLVSSLGYGFLWNHPGTGRVELGRNATRWVADATRQVDYYLTVGNSCADIMERYAEATGHSPTYPEWASGFWQCKLRYRTQEELLEVAREYKRRNLPLSVIVVDYFHWTKMGEWKFDPSEWPNPKEMIRELDEMGVKLMVSIWPTVNPDSENHEYMASRGMLVRNERGIPVHIRIKDKGQGKHMPLYDAMNPEARAFIWDKVRSNYYKYGIKVFWLDACEPEIVPPDQDNIRYYLGNGREVAALYPLLHEQAFYEGMKEEGENEVLTLCRSAWAGSQRYGAAVWSGDIPSTFDALRRQVPAGLNMGLSGIPWWTTDIGGFHGGDVDDPGFRELLIRWFQYAVFCPIFRLHGCRKPRQGEKHGPNEVWSFGKEACDILREQLLLRERLRPYVMEQMRMAQQRGIPPMRPLFFDFPEDIRTWDIEDEFMFGADILVAPVLYEGARKRKVYLPAGTIWRDAWTEEKHDGGEEFEADAPLSRIPVYVRGKHTLPFRA